MENQAMKMYLLAAACGIAVPLAASAQEQTLDFDLECAIKTAEGASEAPPRIFHVQINTDNQAAIMEKGVSSATNRGVALADKRPAIGRSPPAPYLQTTP